ncbi:hypothetical protein GCM10010493_74840 [Streptomyces lavendulae subsp. grasserius]
MAKPPRFHGCLTRATGPWRDPGDRFAGLVGRLPQAVGHGLLEAGERGVGQGDVLKPFHVCHAVPTGHDEAQWVPVLRGQRQAVHRAGDQHLRVRARGDRQGKAAPVVLGERAQGGHVQGQRPADPAGVTS